MKKFYEEPMINWIILNSTDVITTSGEIDNETPDEENPF